MLSGKKIPTVNSLIEFANIFNHKAYFTEMKSTMHVSAWRVITGTADHLALNGDGTLPVSVFIKYQHVSVKGLWSGLRYIYTGFGHRSIKIAM